MTMSESIDAGNHWRPFEIEVQDCTLFYMSFFSYGQQEDQARWKPLSVSSAIATSSQLQMDLQLLDSFDALNGLFPNRVIVNFRQANERVMSFNLKLSVQGFDSGDFIQFRTGKAASSGAITVKAWTQSGLITALKSRVDVQMQSHVLTW